MNNKKSFSNFLNNRFQISNRKSTIKTETVGGVVNFLMLVYVMVVIPNILTGAVAGSPAFWNAIFMATIISVIVSTIAMGIGANLPLVLAPGIGLTSYFATLISTGAYTFSQSLTIALIAGVVFIIVTLLGFRQKLINGLPAPLKLAIPSGIGLFILNIGANSSNGAIIDFLSHGPTFQTSSGAAWVSAVVCMFGLLLILILQHYKVKGSIFFGIIGATVLHLILQALLGVNPFAVLSGANWLPPFGDLFKESFFKFDFKGVFVHEGKEVWASILSAVLIIFSYTLVDLFDTVGTLFGATKGTTLTNEKGDIHNVGRAFWVDSSSTILGAVVGVPGCTVYVESMAGIKTGARTGLSAVVTALLFLVAMFMSPLFMLIPASATASALIYVGLIMFESVKEINFSQITSFVPAIFTIIVMPLTNNISYGIGAGLIMYVLLMLLTKQGKRVHIITYVLAIMFLLFFATQNLL